MNKQERLILRQATIADLTTLRKFEQYVVEAERPYSANLREGAAVYYDLSKLIEDNNSCLMVAEVDGEVVASGYARIEENKAYLQPECYAYLGFMYVSPDFRGNNLIARIIDSLVIWSNDIGVSAYKLDVYTDNKAAISAYRKFGFKPNMLEMWKEDAH